MAKDFTKIITTVPYYVMTTADMIDWAEKKIMGIWVDQTGSADLDRRIVPTQDIDQLQVWEMAEIHRLKDAIDDMRTWAS